MNAPLKAVESAGKLDAAMREIGREARLAAHVLALAPAARKNRALAAMAKAVRGARSAILAANAEDVAEAKSKGATAAFLDRLTLDPKRIEAMAAGLEIIRKLKDPVGAVMASWRRPNGMRIERVRVPLGVMGIIYESRPNVTADAAALCLKAGNAVILRGGSESFRSVRAIHAALVEGLAAAELPTAAISLVPTRDRAAVGMMLARFDFDRRHRAARRQGSGRAGADGSARAGVRASRRRLSRLRRRRSRARDGQTIVLNAKMRRTGVCGAAETLLVDRAGATKLLKPLVTMLIEAGCEVRGDAAVQAADFRVKPASEADWSTEYLDAILTVGVVDGVDAAIARIERYGSHHTDAIVTENRPAAEKFLREVDSAIVLHNASTQFADGGEFGFGGEIGIATGRLHARGPVGVEQLTSFKYRIHGSGQTRP